MTAVPVMRYPAVLVVLAALALSTALALPAAGGTVARLDLESDRAGLGEDLLVSGSGWSTGEMVTVTVCGNYARNGSGDCSVNAASSVGVQRGGTFGVFVTITEPPRPCPCVVMAAGTTTTTPILAPIEIPGTYTLDTTSRDSALPDVARLLIVSSAQIVGDGPVASWFGAAPNRTLLLTIENRGNVAVSNPSLSVAIGKGADPSGFVAPVGLGTIEPGDVRLVEVPLELPAMAFGGYEVVGEITGFGIPARFEASTSSYPFGLAVVAALAAVQILMVWGRNRIRRRLLSKGALQVRHIDGAPVRVRDRDAVTIDLTVPDEPEIVLDEEIAPRHGAPVMPVAGRRAEVGVVREAESVIRTASGTGLRGTDDAGDSTILVLEDPDDDLIPRKRRS